LYYLVTAGTLENWFGLIPTFKEKQV
jgi:hypothetical protein